MTDQTQQYKHLAWKGGCAGIEQEQFMIAKDGT